MKKLHFTTDEIGWITTSPRTVNSANISTDCPVCRKVYKLQLSLDPDKPLKEGYVRFPEDDQLQCCGKSFNMSEIRNNIEQFYGWPDYDLKYSRNTLNN